jgi:tRNA threonylcarbamoyl adenosine modification protein (Sua5/YciO/YrdC/YwlC family)
MTALLYIHPDNPQQRLLMQAADILRRGGIIVYPTDSTYALACHLGDKDALARIRQIRQLSASHLMTLICRDLSELGQYARVENQAFRALKRLIPGPYTFLLKASKEVPKRLLHPKRKSVGLRVPDNKITLGLLECLGEPLLSTSLVLPGQTDPLQDPFEIQEHLDGRVDAIIDAGWGGNERTTVIDLTEGEAMVVRQGKGVF